VESARANLRHFPAESWSVERADLVAFSSQGYEVVYSIGVLHHLDEPRAGFEAVVRNTRPGGRFHCWVYAREGNAVVIALVDPLRRLASRLPWWLTKYGLATPLAVPFYAYAKLLCALPRWRRCARCRSTATRRGSGRANSRSSAMWRSTSWSRRAPCTSTAPRSSAGLRTMRPWSRAAPM
jgi:SAM-dependent methyltransferase